MKLNPDCIRQILLVVEEQTGYHEYTSAFKVAEKVDFPLDVVLYHIDQCELNGFFTKVHHYTNGDDNSTIFDLSPKGHEFISNARSLPVWNEVLTKVEPLKPVSIAVLSELAKAIVRSKLGL